MLKIFNKSILLLIIIFIISCNKNKDPVSSNGGGIEPPLLPLYYNYPSWHPDGEWIAATHTDSIDANNDGKIDSNFSGTWLIHAQTGEKYPLIKNYGRPDWSPDGQKLALGRNAHIFTIEVQSLYPAVLDTNSFLQLTTEGNNFFPSWSSNGEWIAYDSNMDSPNGMNFIWIMRSNGNSKKRLIHTPEIGEVRKPDWSPNGNKIAHVRYDPQYYSTEIFVMDTSGSNSVRLTFNENRDMDPVFSPNGKYIAYYSKPQIGAPGIWIADSLGFNPPKISPEYAWAFDWSPDGEKIVFVYFDYKTSRSGNGHLWLINSDGSNLKQLTF